jgi:DNA-binding transcriptional LysR family regulator
VIHPVRVVSGRGDTRTPVDTELEARGLARQVGIVIPNLQMVPALLESSDMTAMVPSRVMRNFGGLVSFPPPIPVSGFPMHLAWHRRRTRDAALQHVAAILGEVLR